MKKILIVVLCFAMAISVIPPLHLSAQAMVDDEHLFDEYDHFYDDFFDTFDFAEDFALGEAATIEPLSIPAGNATRAEAMALLLRAIRPDLLTNTGTPNPRFPDVQVQHWFYPIAGWARNLGWTQGCTTTGNFLPNTPITRQEFIAMAVRAHGLPHLHHNLAGFTDVNQISSWALPYMRTAVARGWIQGTNGRLMPQDPFRRTDSVTFVSRVAGRTPTFPSDIRTIIWNANGGSGVTPWQRLSGTVIGQPLPTSTWLLRTFRGWSSTDDRTTRGATIAANTRINNNVTFSARWRNPERHLAHWHSHIITLYPFSFNSTWQTAINNGINSWNDTDTPIYIWRNFTNSNNTVTARNFEWDYLGLFWRRASSGTEVTRFDIELNSRVINLHATNVSQMIESVMAHELGHAIGLQDGATRGLPIQGGSTTASIMNTRTVAQWQNVRRPTAFDVQSANWLH